MPKRSVRWPLRLVRGRVELTPDPVAPGGNVDRGESLRQIVRARLLDTSSAHPFRPLVGLGDVAFRLSDPRERSAAVDRIVASFAGLERARRAKIVSVEIDPPGEGGKVRVRCSYYDLELGQLRDLEVER